MGHAAYPWRPLGALLVHQGLLTEAELSAALVEQRLNGRLLGQILVDREYLSGFTLTRALVQQHGVELRTKAGPPLVSTTEARAWRPLGRVLVERRLVREEELEAALTEQERTRRRLGEILVARGTLTGLALAGALAEQHGMDSAGFLERDGLETALVPAPSPQQTYRVEAPSLSGAYESANFLEAADVAAELAARGGGERVELLRVQGDASETIWTSDAARERTSLVDTFGFDPTRWDSGRR